MWRVNAAVRDPLVWHRKNTLRANPNATLCRDGRGEGGQEGDACGQGEEAGETGMGVVMRLRACRQAALCIGKQTDTAQPVERANCATSCVSQHNIHMHTHMRTRNAHRTDPGAARPVHQGHR